MKEDAVQGQVVCVSREEVLQALNETKTEKSLGPSDVLLELIVASRGARIQVMPEICHSPRWIWNASRIGSKNSGSNLQGGKVILGTVAAIEL